MKILVLDGVSEKGVQILKDPGFEVDVIIDKLSEDELIKIMPKYNGVIVRSATTITSKIIQNAPNLQAIGRAGVGVDNIDVDAATNNGIIVVNAPDGNTIAATEHTMALMLSVARLVPPANENLKKGKWMRKEYTGVELKGKTLGIIGLGRIGTAVAKRAQSFEMKTIGYDPYITEEKAKEHGITAMDLDGVFKNADFITIHLPLTKDTKNLCNKDTFAKMKKGVRIINAARGGIINEEDLYEAVKNGIVAGAALDVFEKEPTTESPLFELENVIVTPHLGASTKEAQINVALDVAREMVSIFNGEMAQNAVNLPRVPAEVMAAIKPFIPLAEKLGKFIAQTVKDIESIEITYNGNLAELTVSPLSTMALKGILGQILDQAVTIVNVNNLAKERGIKFIESKVGDIEDYTELITISVKGQKEKRSVSGTLFGQNDPRIVLLDGFRVDTTLDGNMIAVLHTDKPKVIGAVGTILGTNNINIASLQVDRQNAGGEAVMLISVDAVVPDEVIKDISKTEGVLGVKFISL